MAKLSGLYDRDQRSLRTLTVDEVPTLAVWAGISTALVGVLALALPVQVLSLPDALHVWVVAFAGAAVFRALVRAGWRRLTPPERALIVGRGSAADAVQRKLALFPEIHVTVVAEVEALTSADLRETAAWSANIERIILALPAFDEQLFRDLVIYSRQNQNSAERRPACRALGRFGAAQSCRRDRLRRVRHLGRLRSTLLLKRSLDLLVCLPTLALLTPVFAIVAIAIKLDSRGPVLHRQRRGSLNGRPFRMLKFRTMVEDAEEQLRGSCFALTRSTNRCSSYSTTRASLVSDATFVGGASTSCRSS